MCKFSYVHYHHQTPCTRPSSLVVRYSYCSQAPVNPVTSEVTPCLSALLDPAHGLYPDKPCARGNCLISPACSSGTCRLQDLNGRWVCCKCKRGGNIYRACHHRKRGCPDTFCYHDICGNCAPDVEQP